LRLDQRIESESSDSRSQSAQGLGLPTSNLGWATDGLPMADFFSTEDEH
jgi:hypothetical protein